MESANPLASPPLEPPRGLFTRVTDVVVFAAGLALFYGVIAVARTWAGPFRPAVAISLSPWALPQYAAYSLLRLAIAYLLSLLFAILYGYVAAYSKAAERIMIPLLDILQSIPVLSFLPGVMLAMFALFPAHEVGVELGSILLIFTGQVWNMAFSFYASVKSIPRELREATRIFQFSPWQRFLQLDLPFAAIGLVWNSIMAVAGGWFFLMACEQFVLGSRDFRLPGLGSYLQTAADEGDTRAILWGLAAMIGVVVLVDQVVWRTVLAWAHKFKFEQVESAPPPRSPLLALLRRSGPAVYLQRHMARPLAERVTSGLAARWRARRQVGAGTAGRPWLRWSGAALGLAVVLFGCVQGIRELSGIARSEMLQVLAGAGATFLRVLAALALGLAWTVPVGVAIGMRPRLAKFAQPLAQIGASVPATALFPVVLLLLIRVGGGMGIASIVLILLGTQWYILFNVIAGAMALPSDLQEAATIFRFSALDRWRLLILPGIFPSLVTGLVTASGGAWNASVVAEYFRLKGHTFSITGLGATISRATDAGNFRLLLAATIVMSMVVVGMHRVVWHRLYRLAHSRYKLEG